MSGAEIREKIIENNQRIEKILDKSIFTLNREIVTLREENKKLQSICHHEYDDLGFCIYCDIKVE